MSLGIDDELDDSTRQENEYPRIARPGAASGLPALELRGLGAPSASSAPATTLGAASAAPALAPAIQSAPIAKPNAPKTPTPLETRTAADEAELGRLQSTGSGISQIHNRVARGALRGLETIGDVIAPRTTSMIPGTELHHNYLENQQRGRIGEDLGEAEKQAATAKTAADTGEAEARTNLTNAQAAELGKPKPKEEKWDEFAGFTDMDGTPLLREENSGQVVRSDNKKPPSGFKAIAPKNDKPDSAEQQFIDAELARGKTVQEAIAEYEKAAHPDKPEKPQRQLGVTPDGKVIEITPGMTLPEGTQTIGGDIKENAGKKSAQDALAYAKDYMASGKFTGPGDEALMEKYFELAKPSSGFRMTQPQIEMLTKARDLMGGMKARATHLFRPEAPYFSDEQRKQIVETMSQIQESRGQHGAASAGGELTPPKEADPGMKWQHRTVNGQTEWRQVPLQ